MFVAIAVDPGSLQRARELADLLAQYGFKKVQNGLWESYTVSPDTLNRVKKDLDKATDGFDRLRFFQYPMDETLVLSSLKEKQWRRMVAKVPQVQETAFVQVGLQNRAARTRVVQRPVKKR